ncbi:MAG TPA: hypothetical protein VJ717_03200 [Gemmatimonadaceae bacterium]|nr:hypothetical protein [Gemmatimonadaceae bacterium]
MPMPERYYRELVQRHLETERQAKRDTWREWIRVLSGIFFWTLLGLLGLALAFHTYDLDRAWVYWWAGAFVWVTGVLGTCLAAYLRGVHRGDWI